IGAGDSASITNLATGTIQGADVGISAGADAYVLNQGHIENSGVGISLTGGTVVNAADASISSGTAGAGIGIDITDAGAAVANQGNIYGRYAAVELVGSGAVTNSASGVLSGAYGIVMFGGGEVTNQSGATIGGTLGAIKMSGGTDGSLLNYGYIHGAVSMGELGSIDNHGTIAGADAVLLRAGGTVTNRASGRLLGRVAIYGSPGSVDNLGYIGSGVGLAGGTVTNSGTLEIGADYASAVYSTIALHVTNLSGGTIANSGGDGAGIGSGSGSTVVNDGRIAETGGGAGIRIPDGYLYNAAGGTIIGADGVVFGGTVASTVVNRGFVSGSSVGVVLGDGGAVTNTGTGTIIGAKGIELDASGTVTNAGTIEATGGYQPGIQLNQGGKIVNQSGGRIIGAAGGIAIDQAYGSVDNLGYIAVTGTDAAAVSLYGTSRITNAGTIEVLGNGSTGIVLNAAGTIVDQAGGTIAATTAGSKAVIGKNGGTVTVDAGGTIDGYIGVVFYGTLADTVVNHGTIESSRGAGGYALELGGGNDVLTLYADSHFVGIVDGESGTNTLALAAGTPGVIYGLGREFVNFQDVAMAAGAVWSLSGASTVDVGTTLVDAGLLSVGYAAPLANDGTIEVYGVAGTYSTLTVANTLSGYGTIGISDGVVDLASAAAGTVRFGAGKGMLVLEDAAATALTIKAMGVLDAIDLVNVTYSAIGDGIIQAGGVVTVEQNGVIVAELDFAGLNKLALVGDGHGGTDIVSTATYSGYYNAPVSLIAQNITIAGSAYFNVPEAGATALYGSADTPRAINNSGIVQETGSGGIAVDLAGGGAFVNAAGGYVYGDTGIELLQPGGLVQNNGSIMAGTAGIYLSGPGSVYNYGVVGVTAAAGVGINMAGGYLLNDGTITATGVGATAVVLGDGTFINANGGHITGPLGVRIIHGLANIANSGSIEATSGAAIYLYAGGVTNVSGGMISGPQGVRIIHGLGTLVNAGSLGGDAGDGAYLGAGGYVTNEKGALLDGYNGVRIIHGLGVIANQGTIEATQDAIYLGYGGTVVNGVGAYIGGSVGVEFGTTASGGVLIDYGTIRGTGYSVLFRSPGDTLDVESGAAFVGTIAGGGGILRLVGGDGTIAGLGTTGTLSGTDSGTFTGFGTYIFNAAGDWTLDGGGTIGTAQELIVRGTLDVASGTLDVAGSLVNSGTITLDGSVLIDETSLSGGGTIELAGGATLELGAAASAVIDFMDATGVLQIGDPAGVSLTVGGFVAGDVIDFTSLAYSSTDSVSYGDGVLTVTQNGTIVTELTMTGLGSGVVFALESDGKSGTDLVIQQPSGNPELVSSVTPPQVPALNGALQGLEVEVAAADGKASAALNFFTPPSLTAPTQAQISRGAGGTAVQGDVNIANGTPLTAGEAINLGNRVQGIVLTGSVAAEIVGHAANQFAQNELLVGNLGNDTILGGGGSGTIISGSGSNVIHTGRGDMLVSSGGADIIRSGHGVDQVEAFGSATVVAGSGFTVFSDEGAAAGADRVRGGTGTTVMNSGLGQDTFIGGSGTSLMNDTGAGRVAFEFIRGLGGFDFVSGFNAATDYISTAGNSYGWSDFQARETVVGGSTFVDLGTTRIEFVGVTNLVAADFHS
ncbi:MAG TPA: hypothetical protein VKS60_11810, partial [Stellaceae bacterium]|nr:hypothetical protein [Stellaceae bacterium]